MIIKSIKGDGVEHLVSPVSTDLWGWENLQNVLVPSGIDEDTGEQTYREVDRKVVGKTIEVELHNDGDKPETIAVLFWLLGPLGIANVGASPKEIVPGKSESWSVVLNKRRQATWCLLRM
jgi:hypothetical protein